MGFILSIADVGLVEFEWQWIGDEDIAIRHCINLALLQQRVQFHHKVWVDWNITQFILQESFQGKAIGEAWV